MATTVTRPARREPVDAHRTRRSANSVRSAGDLPEDRRVGSVGDAAAPNPKCMTDDDPDEQDDRRDEPALPADADAARQRRSGARRPALAGACAGSSARSRRRCRRRRRSSFRRHVRPAVRANAPRRGDVGTVDRQPCAFRSRNDSVVSVRRRRRPLRASVRARALHDSRADERRDVLGRLQPAIVLELRRGRGSRSPGSVVKRSATSTTSFVERFSRQRPADVERDELLERQAVDILQTDEAQRPRSDTRAVLRT